MDRPIAIVHFGESSVDAPVIASVLQNDGIACDVTPVVGPDAFHRRLTDFDVDLVLAEHAPPVVDGPGAVRLAHGVRPHLPCISLLRSPNEPLEAAFFSAGAVDVVVSRRHEQLVRAVRRALGEASERVARARAEIELHSLEAQFKHAQRLESLGRLAGGVAHDFNNLLTIINGCGEQLLKLLPPGNESRGLIESILRAGGRGADLTHRLLAFGRRDQAATRIVSLNAILRECEPMLTTLVGETVRLSLNLEPALWDVRADSAEISQVILNLASNARDAMGADGVLTIRTGNVNLVGGSAALAPGAHVEMVIRDTGHGMDDEVRSHIFEPFFTTKSGTHGTGLGLSTVYRIVTEHGGEIHVETAAGRGTSMRILLPRAMPDHTVAPLHMTRPADEFALTTGTETVLLVEDECGVREIISTFLRGAGYVVYEAGTGAEAEQIVRDIGHVDLLLSDVVIPDANGPMLSAKLRRSVPGLKTMLISGYPADALSQAGLDATTSYLPKPFTRTVLLRGVREALEGN
jgi:two-component system cell cycle sensor histidine kinase/response regulator CckA